MFKYPVLNDQQIKQQQEEFIASLKPLDPGIYNFQVLEATEKTSKSGNPMLELVLNVWGHDGKVFRLYDWLVGIESMAFKTKHFWESVGEPEKYISGEAAAVDFLDKSGKLETLLKKDDKGNLRAGIKDYVPVLSKTENDFHDDDIPY